MTTEVINRLDLLKNKFDVDTEPCDKCDDQPLCRNTCDEARLWWTLFAKKFGKGNLGI